MAEKTVTDQVIKKYKYSEEDVKFVEKAIEMAQKSYDEGAFPAGAVIIKNGEIIAGSTSAKFPNIIHHADSKTIDLAMEKLDSQLTDCTMYLSMEPCLMCLSRAYWAGIRRIVFAVKKESVPYQVCYESNLNNYDLMEKFNEKIELVQIEELEDKALAIINKWLEENS